MNTLEEQKQELEVLKSIYPDELIEISDKHFSIKIELYTPSNRKHRFLLDVKYPNEYPETAPELNIEVFEEKEEKKESNGDNDESDSNIVYLSEIIEFSKKDLNFLLNKLNEEAENQIGMPSIFALVTQLKDEAELLFQNKVVQQQKLNDEISLEKEQKEQKKFHGTVVTKESWEKWRLKFREEMEFDKKNLERYNKMHQGKLTGIKIFEKGLVNASDELLLNEIDDY